MSYNAIYVRVLPAIKCCYLEISIIETHGVFNIRVILLTLFACSSFVFIIFTTGFSSADKSTSHQRPCRNSNTGSISYFKVDSEELNWDNAWSLCKIKNSTLPVICNQPEQDALTNYLKTNITSSAVWTSGRKKSFDEWTWLDGQRLTSSGNMSIFILFFSKGACGWSTDCLK